MPIRGDINMPMTGGNMFDLLMSLDDIKTQIPDQHYCDLMDGLKKIWLNETEPILLKLKNQMATNEFGHLEIGFNYKRISLRRRPYSFIKYDEKGTVVNIVYPDNNRGLPYMIYNTIGAYYMYSVICSDGMIINTSFSNDWMIENRLYIKNSKASKYKCWKEGKLNYTQHFFYERATGKCCTMTIKSDGFDIGQDRAKIWNRLRLVRV